MIQCVLIKWLDAEKTEFAVVNWNAVLTSPNVVGLSPDLEYCVKRVPYPVPEYDPRLTNLVTMQEVGNFDFEYSELRQWVTLYQLQSRSAEEKKISVEESEADANFGIFPTHKQLKLLTLSIAIIDRKTAGLNISESQQAVLDKLQAKAQLIWNNHTVCNCKKNQLDAGNLVDLDTDWEKTDPDETNS